MATQGQFVDILLTAGLALVSSVLIMVVRWVMRVVAERDKLADEALANKILTKLEPRFRSLEARIDTVQARVDRG